MQFIICYYSILNLAINSIDVKTSFLIVVSITECSRAKITAPSIVLKHPGILFLTFTFRIARYELLLSNGTI